MEAKKTRKRNRKVEERKTFSINISTKDSIVLAYIAEQKGKSVSAIMRDLVQGYIKENLRESGNTSPGDDSGPE